MIPDADKKRSFQVFLLALVIAGMAACKATDMMDPPYITLTEPVHGTHFNVLDTILIRGTIKSSQTLETISIVLLNAENQPALSPLIISSPSNPTHLDEAYFINDTLLESGSYQIRVQAKDVENVTNAFVDINLQALAREFKYPLVITTPSNEYFEAMIFEDSAWNGKYSWQGDFLSAAVNNPSQLLYISGKSQTGVHAIDLETGQPRWSLPVVQNPEKRYYEGISYSYPYLFIAYFMGYLKGINPDGSVYFTTDEVSTYVPGISCRLGDILLASLHDPVTGSYSLAQFFMPGGTLRHLNQPQSRIISLQPFDHHQVLVFENEEANSTIKILDINDNQLSTLKTLPGDSICEVSAMDQQNYFIACKNALYWFQYASNSLTAFGPAQPFSQIACEAQQGVVYVAKGNSLLRLSYPYGEVLDSIHSPDPIVDIQLIYNK